MFWKSRNVFITGADGFIGSWIAKELVDQGANVFVIMRDIKKRCSLDLLSIKDKVEIIHGDIVDYQLLLRILNEKEIDTVFHLAAQAIVGIANTSPLSTFKSNIEGTWNLLDACRVYGKARAIIVASSDKAYGKQKVLPYTEDTPLLYAKTYALPIAVTRNANTYGGADMNFSRIIPDAIISLLKGKEFVIRSDGKFQRDYMYIKDAVSAYLTLAEHFSEKTIGEAFNFGTGKPVSVLELYDTIAKLINTDARPKILGKAENEIDKQYLDISKVKRFFSWSPKYTLEQGLKETIQWYKK